GRPRPQQPSPQQLRLLLTSPFWRLSRRPPPTRPLRLPMQPLRPPPTPMPPLPAPSALPLRQRQRTRQTAWRFRPFQRLRRLGIQLRAQQRPLPPPPHRLLVQTTMPPTAPLSQPRERRLPTVRQNSIRKTFS